MTDHQVVTPEGWVEARKQLLAKEKEFTRLRDQLSQARRDFPGCASPSNMHSKAPKGSRHLRNYSPDAASSSSTISCSAPIEAGCEKLLVLGRQF